ncbi:MAG: glycosyltransferase family 2 protein [Gammaproteobacteria bacterium]|nr:glycosyltransferase family 2 protein [Gammaproteobacteria bacterium]MBU1654620.1 glycosyltransferase family 2 protein [Gammaproteobacteria bacterium]MBU1959950.1 glycosyltransferase family 2 protein [Gammaproteobacteria bacterium]
MPSISVIIPARNEANALARLLPLIKQQIPDAEIIVINDGSSDDTAHVAIEHDCICISHPYSMGNGAAIKTGARAANGDILICMDADGQHDPRYIPALVETLAQGYDMVVGARDSNSQASLGRLTANTVYNLLASFITGHKVRDLTSGFRAVRASKFRQFLSLLPNGFSYPTTITMAFFRSGFPVAYIPIQAPPREGKSHIHPLIDGVRFLMVIFKVGTLYSPLKIFFPISLTFFSTGLIYYLYTFIISGRFTNMSALLFSTSVIIFLIGLVSEQITQLMYADSGRTDGQ